MIDSPAPDSLSETELEILRLLATGATNREIARTRGISEATVKKHVTNINVKLGTGNRTEAVRRALELGLVTVKTPESGEAASEAEGHQAAALALSAELERTRRRTRQITRWFVLTGVVALAVTIALVWLWLSGPPDSGPDHPAPPTVALTAVPIAWGPGVSLPSRRSGLALVVEPPDPPHSSGRVYAIAGQGPAGVLAETLRYDPKSLVWERRADKPTAVSGVVGVTVQGHIVVPGGCTDDGRATDVTEIYDFNSDTWSSGPHLPHPVCGYALAESDGQIYLFGGRASTSAGPERWVWRYQLGAPRWIETDEPLPLPRSDAAAVMVGENEIHLLGGRDESGPQSNHWLFRPFAPSGQWATEGGPVLPEGRAGLGAAYHLGRLYVTGGGWDADVDPWAIVLDNGLWLPMEPLRLVTPQRGAPLTTLATVDGQWLATAGGEADGRLLNQYNLFPLIRFSNIYLTAPR